MSNDNPLSDRFDRIEPNQEADSNPTESLQGRGIESLDNMDKNRMWV